MRLSRRTFSLGCGIVMGSAIVSRRASADEGVDAVLNDRFRDFESGDVPEFRVLGTQPATSDEAKLAQSILEQSSQTTPLEVFKYFLDDTHRNVDKERYNGGWKVRWNPIIVAFFNVTRDGKPRGDTTPWCAASLNWALQRCGMKTTGSSSSGSFRSAPGQTDAPVAGDIVVFQETDAAGAKAGHGHVGLYLDHNDDDDTILVLGGNQINSAGHHEFSTKWIGKSSKHLTLNSFHSMAAFK